jgi:hypothetical protein
MVGGSLSCRGRKRIMEEEVISLTPAMLPVIPDFRFVDRGGGHISHSCGRWLVEMEVAAVAFHSCGLQCHDLAVEHISSCYC